jgi:hypothetical protein
MSSKAPDRWWLIELVDKDTGQRLRMGIYAGAMEYIAKERARTVHRSLIQGMQTGKWVMESSGGWSSFREAQEHLGRRDAA